MTTAPSCRFCRTPLVHSFVDLGEQPLSNAYLHARVCDACFLVQVDDPVAADAIFDADYAYFSSYSASWVAHAKRYAEAMTARFALTPQSLVMEIASNDGYLLQHFVAAGIPVLGIEPAANTAEAARVRGVKTEVMFFNAANARRLAAGAVAADLIAANNVLAHVPDIGDFVAGFREVLRPQGVLTFEFPHLLKLIELVQFDTIYHEHYSYLSALAVERVLAAQGLRAFDVERLPTHGGSLRLFCAHLDSDHRETQSLRDLRAEEAAASLGRIEGYQGFAARAAKVRDGFLYYLRQAKAAGRKVAAYGAAAKGNTFLNYAGVTADDIVCVFDANPVKQGRFLPGSHVPILAPDQVGEVRPDDLLILPWNLKDEIIGQMGIIRSWGGRFVTASPDVTVIA